MFPSSLDREEGVGLEFGLHPPRGLFAHKLARAFQAKQPRQKQIHAYTHTNSTMSQKQQTYQYESTWDDYDYDDFDEYDDYGDYSVNQRGGGGGGGKSKTEKRQANRGGGRPSVYTSKHIRAKVSQRITRK